MASFADQISQFNPYIQQLPVDAMTQVGMYKQQKYDEGVQKIQSYIDNVAGMDVIRDIDKGYLQSKLNELGSKLKTVAAGDFSNYQLVNSVGGMATQIVRDPYVQNALSSTTRYRKELANMEAAIKEGKSSQSNIYDFTTKSNKWLNSMNLDDRFNDRYTPFRDVKKTAMEAIKALHPKLREYDVPFEMDGKGNINTSKIAAAMRRFKIEGIDENQIKQAIYASLTPDDVNQLQIDANYQFRDIDSNKLVNLAQLKYDSSVKNAKETLDFLRAQKRITRLPEVSEKIDERIEYYEKQLGKDGVKGLLDEEYEDELSEAMNNPERVKLSLYKDGFVKEFANAFSWKSESDQYLTNPIQAQINWAKNFAFENMKFNTQTNQWERTFAQKEREIKIDAEMLALKKAEVYGVDGEWTPLTNPTDRVERAKEHFGNFVESVTGTIDANMKALKKKYTEAEIKRMLNDWDENDTKATTVPTDARTLVQQIIKDKDFLASLEETEKNVRRQADKNVGIAELKNKVLQNKPGIDVSFRGQRLTLSPDEVLSLESATKTKTQTSRAGTITEVQVDRSKLNPNQLRFVDALQGIRYGKISPSPTPDATRLQVQVNSLFSQYDKDVNTYKDAINRSEEEFNKLLAPRITTLVPEIKAIPRNKDGKVPPVLYDGISQLIYAAADGAYQANDDYDQSTALSMISDENIKNTRTFVYRNGDKYELRMTNPNVGKEQVIRLDANGVRGYIGPNYVSDKTQESIRMELGRGNTNLTADPKRSLMQSRYGDFPGITKYDVMADLNQDLSNPGLYIPMINLRKKNGRYQNFEIAGFNGSERVGYDQGRKELGMLNDVTLMKLLKQLYPDFDFSQFDY